MKKMLFLSKFGVKQSHLSNVHHLIRVARCAKYLGDKQHATDQKARQNVIVIRIGPQPYLHLYSDPFRGEPPL